MSLLRFPKDDREETNEEDAIIRRWLKLADVALESDESPKDREQVPVPDRRTA